MQYCKQRDMKRDREERQEGGDRKERSMSGKEVGTRTLLERFWRISLYLNDDAILQSAL